MNPARGRFISLEGIDGAGKSTHLPALVHWLTQRGRRVVQTREPGGTALGEALRQLLLHQDMSVEAETLLLFAARAQLVQQVIVPALEQGQWVVSDRFTDASFAYQQGGRGVACAHLEFLEDWVVEGLQPDLTFLFDLDPATAQQRLQRAGPELDRFEQQGGTFFERVRAAYLERANRHAARFCLLPAAQAPNQLWALMEQELAQRFP